MKDKKRTFRRSSNKGNLGSFLIMGMVLMAGFFFAGMGQRPKRVKLVEEGASGTNSMPSGMRLAWEPIPFDPPDYGRLPADTPSLEPLVDIDLEEASHPSSPNHGKLLDRIKLVVQKNVVPGVAEELDGLLRAHRIIYTVDPRESKAAASFSIGEDGYPRLMMKARNLAEIGSQQDLVGYMLVVAHEFIHYKQWQGTTDPQIRETYKQGAADRIDAKTCQNLWHSELEAYRETNCLWGNQLGLHWTTGQDPRADYCARIKSPEAFAQAFYYHMAEDDQDKVVLACKEIWWDEAGGPRQK